MIAVCAPSARLTLCMYKVAYLACYARPAHMFRLQKLEALSGPQGKTA